MKASLTVTRLRSPPARTIRRNALYAQQLAGRPFRERRPGLGGLGPVPGRVLHEEEEDPEAEQGDAEAHDEDGVVGVPGVVQEGEGQDRAEKGADRVERPVDAEGPAQGLRRAAQRDEGVARCAADALADPVEEEEAGRGGESRGGQQADLGGGGDDVSGPGHLLVPLAPVGEHPARHPEEGAHPLIEAVEHAELHRGHLQLRHHVFRQDGVDRLRRDVGQQAVGTEELDVAVDLLAAAATAPAPGRGAPEPSAPGPEGPSGLPGVSGAGRSRTEEYRGAYPSSGKEAPRASADNHKSRQFSAVLGQP